LSVASLDFLNNLVLHLSLLIIKQIYKEIGRSTKFKKSKKRKECWNPINQFKSATLSCLSQTRTWISNVICRCLFLCSVSSVKMRGDCSFWWYWWNWWPTLFKLSFLKTNQSENKIGVRDFITQEKDNILLRNRRHHNLVM